MPGGRPRPRIARRAGAACGAGGGAATTLERSAAAHLPLAPSEGVSVRVRGRAEVRARVGARVGVRVGVRGWG